MDTVVRRTLVRKWKDSGSTTLATCLDALSPSVKPFRDGALHTQLAMPCFESAVLVHRLFQRFICSLKNPITFEIMIRSTRPLPEKIRVRKVRRHGCRRLRTVFRLSIQTALSAPRPLPQLQFAASFGPGLFPSRTKVDADVALTLSYH